ncbi:RNA polymerase-binding protein DksA [Campylobacter geochelonis]|uniref:DnaK suppressor protein n=1 Tax=Campylobacter geochelonis TaxID=1780362 RepID=A0A128EDC0_9BACT|nr:RNA polymerase-binding protein DksA [Campylobacter geochelonis]QKF70717.1 DnaK suppressor protein [Campylobacter geochelonis]CZE45731.1 DnaK suppressor protein [Campylobacter geochelonis]CZE46919.1 DnaK suppressor protein [Campylobacter geochelonis]CZE50238.1 DnaK suppressor protein [Campylobacter geochelonis]
MKKSELEFFKKMLEERRVQIVKNINVSANEINELRESGAVDEFDMASINSDSNLEYSISAKQREELYDIDISLSKIKNGTYGICEMCEEEISVARLKAKPNAKLCISCKEISEKNKV